MGDKADLERDGVETNVVDLFKTVICTGMFGATEDPMKKVKRPPLLFGITYLLSFLSLVTKDDAHALAILRNAKLFGNGKGTAEPMDGYAELYLGSFPHTSSGADLERLEDDLDALKATINQLEA